MKPVPNREIVIRNAKRVLFASTAGIEWIPVSELIKPAKPDESKSGAITRTKPTESCGTTQPNPLAKLISSNLTIYKEFVNDLRAKLAAKAEKIKQIHGRLTTQQAKNVATKLIDEYGFSIDDDGTWLTPIPKRRLRDWTGDPIARVVPLGKPLITDTWTVVEIEWRGPRDDPDSYSPKGRWCYFVGPLYEWLGETSRGTQAREFPWQPQRLILEPGTPYKRRWTRWSIEPNDQPTAMEALFAYGAERLTPRSKRLTRLYRDKHEWMGRLR